MASSSKWSVDQLVNVKPRTWAGINRPGGVGKITKLHYASNGFVESLDVKYLVGSGSDAKLDLDFCEAYEPLESKGRSRRGRDLYTASPAAAKKRDVSPPHDDDDADRPAKKARKKQSSKEQPTKSRTKVQRDENTDPKERSKTVRRQAKKSAKVAKKEEKKKPPTTHVVVNKKKCSVSPLANTPAELRNVKKKQAKTSSKKQTARKSLHGTASLAKPTVVSEAKSEFVIKKASRPKDTAAAAATLPKPVSLASKCAPKKTLTNPRKLPSSKTIKTNENRVPLKRVYETQVDRANTFVEGLVGKPKAATSLLSNDDDANEQNPAAETAVTLSPPNTERIDLFVSKLSELFGDDDDGVDKEELLDKVNKKLVAEGGLVLDRQEMEDCLSALSSDGKVMVSDGVVYSF